VIYTDGVHVLSDAPGEDYAELHDFARKIGLRRAWFQGDHYDLTTRLKAIQAVEAGAVLVDILDLGRLSLLLRARRPDAPHARALVERLGVKDDWRPAALDPALAAEKNTELMRRFAPGRRIGRRGTDHL
jgi:hypothetical protein